MIKASIIGATGYTGQELVRILAQHSAVEIVGLGTQNYVGESFAAVYPHFRNIVNLICQDNENPRLVEQADVVFVALPHGLSVGIVEKLLKQNKKVIDLGADFRLKSPEVYKKWYKVDGPDQEQLANAVYGLPEIHREAIKKANLIANPGCYPTTAILALAPLLTDKMIETADIIIDSKSGVSGAGRSLKTGSLFAEVDSDFKAYGFPGHRHAPEIEQELSLLAGEEIEVTFTPHLVPMTRGMLSTVYTSLKKKYNNNDIIEIFQEFYRDEPFIRVLPPGTYPQTKWVSGTNFCDIGINCDQRKNKLTVISAIDNLFKGASGQAVQNMNIICGLDETAGLNKIAIYP